MEPDHAVFDTRQESAAEHLPPWHSGLRWIQPEPARSKHDVGFPLLDDPAEVGNDGRIVLAVRVEHDHDVGAHLERVPIAGLLVAAVAKVLLVPDDIEAERGGDADRGI